MYKKVKTSAVYQNIFAKYSEDPEITHDLLEGIEKFLCDMYGKPRLSKLGDVRYA